VDEIVVCTLRPSDLEGVPSLTLCPTPGEARIDTRRNAILTFIN
jgi:hypothetical protein